MWWDLLGEDQEFAAIHLLESKVGHQVGALVYLTRGFLLANQVQNGNLVQCVDRKANLEEGGKILHSPRLGLKGLIS